MKSRSGERSVSDSSFSLELCPRCEEGILRAVRTAHPVTVAGSTFVVPDVQLEECRRCGYRALSGREVRLFDVLLAGDYPEIADVVAAVRAAGFRGMFLRESEAEAGLGFSAREYVDAVASDLRDVYLDNETGHVLAGLERPVGTVGLDLGGRRFSVHLPKIGEGENGVVFDYDEDPASVLKLAKPRAYSREHLRLEFEVTDFFAAHGVPVPAIPAHDRYGSYLVKERLAGVSLAVVYGQLGAPSAARHRRARAAVERFIAQLLELFVRFPHAKTSVSPNNIFLVEEGERCSCLLVDTGPAPAHDYSRFDFADYWEVVVPQKIERYRAVGFI